MNLKQLHYFVIAAAEGGLRRASERLHIAQPALSRQIHELEREIGVKLFDRTSHGMDLTPAGEFLNSEAQALLEQIHSIRLRTQRAAKGQVGVLKIAFSRVTGELKGAVAAFADLRRAFPEVDCQCILMQSTRQLEAIVGHEIDVGVFYHPDEPSIPQLASRPLRTERYLLAVPSDHPLAARKQVHLADLQGEDMIFVSATSGAAFYEQHLATFLRGGLAPNIAIEATSATVALNMIAAGLGIGFVLSSLQYRQPMSEVRYIEVPDFDVRMLLSVMWEASRETPTIQHFVKLLVEHLSETQQDTGLYPVG